MGKFKKNVSNEAKQKRPRNKKHKTEIVFDELKRKEYLTGFSKRKQERKKKAHEDIIEKLKEEKRQIKLKKREELDKKWKELNLATDLDSIVEPKTIDMQTHTVTVTDVSDVDFVGGAGFMLGTNKGLYQETQDEDGAEETKEESPEDIHKKLKKISAPKKLSHQKHKNFSHTMSGKHLSKKKHAAKQLGKPKKKKPRRNANNKN